MNNISELKSSKAQFFIPNEQKNTPPNCINFQEKAPQNQENPAKSWHTRVIHRMDQWDEKLDHCLPNFTIQERIESVGRYIQNKFEPLEKFNQWLDKNGQKEWYKQLTTFLYKLPMRAIRNLVRLIYNIIKEACYAVVHPLKAANGLAKMLVTLVYELTKPETWSKIGAGVIGASLGQALVSGNPLSIIGLGIGGAMLVGGLSVGVLKAAIQAQKEEKLQEIKKHLWEQVKQLPESMLTGFCMGLIVGGIQRAIYEHQMKHYRVSNYEQARQYADSFVEEHHLPPYSSVTLDPSGKIIIEWSSGQLNQFDPRLFARTTTHPAIEFPTKLRLELQPGGTSHLQVRFHGYDGFEGYNYTQNMNANDLGLNGRLYPSPTENIALSQMGALSGSAQVFKATFDKKAES